MIFGVVLGIALIAGLAVAAFFASVEGAFFALSAPADESVPGVPSVTAEPVDRLLRRLDRLQHGVALGHLLAVVWTGAVVWAGARWIAGGPLGWPALLGVGVATAVVVLVAAELAPKALAMERPWRWARLTSRPLSIWLGAMMPVTKGIGLLVDAAERMVGPAPATEPLTPEDVRSIVAETSARADLDLDERRMITSIFGFAETTVREVMTPRPDVVAVEASMSWPEIVDRVRASEHSRVPVYRDSLDEIEGILYAKDVLAVVHGLAEPAPLETLLREATFVPEGKKIDDALQDFQRERIHLAIVVDEYGGMEGVVTLEDVLEEFVGEIQDEYDRESPMVEPLADGSLRIDGGLDADDFNELTGSDLETEGVDTIGGIVARELGRVAEGGEAIEAEGWRFVVEAVEGKRIVKVRASRIEGGDE